MEKVKYVVGWGLAKLFPHKVDEVRNNFTIPDYYWDGSSGRIVERAIHFYLGSEMKQQEGKTPGDLEAIHRNFWSKAETYFSVTKDRTETVHIPAYQDIVCGLIPMLVDKNIQTACEFGTGDGKWLNYLSQQWPTIKNFIGIDISERQVENNNRMYPHHTFIRSDLIEWVDKNATPNTLYHTCGGVLEYLAEDSVKHLLKILRERAKNSTIFFIEPIYGNYDLDRDIGSEISDREYSYTHNHIRLLTAAGFEIIRHEEREVMGCRMSIVIASNDRSFN